VRRRTHRAQLSSLGAEAPVCQLRLSIGSDLGVVFWVHEGASFGSIEFPCSACPAGATDYYSLTRLFACTAGTGRELPPVTAAPPGECTVRTCGHTRGRVYNLPSSCLFAASQFKTMCTNSTAMRCSVQIEVNSGWFTSICPYPFYHQELPHDDSSP
jgi:hypothetical protein